MLCIYWLSSRFWGIPWERQEYRRNSSLSIVNRLITEANPVGERGCILYTDNWYTIIRLARFLYEKYKWLFVGTVVFSDSKMRKENNLPFRKLSTGSIKKVANRFNTYNQRNYLFYLISFFIHQYLTVHVCVSLWSISNDLLLYFTQLPQYFPTNIKWWFLY